MIELAEYPKLIDRKISQAIKILAEFFFISSAKDIEHSKKDITKIRCPVYISLYVLGYKDIPWKKLRVAEARVEILARIHVDYGQHALNAFNFWECRQMLLSFLNDASEHGYNSMLLYLFQIFVYYLSELVLDERNIATWIGVMEELLKKSNYLSIKRALEVRNLLLDKITPLIESHLGLYSHLCRGMPSGSTLSYPKIYRLAKHAGCIEAILNTSGYPSENNVETQQSRIELKTIIDRFNLINSVPQEVHCIQRAIKSLDNLKLPLKEDDMCDLYFWIQSYLSIVFDASSDCVYRIARDMKYITLLLENDDNFGDIIPLLCESLYNGICDIASPSVQVNFNEILLQPLQKHDNSTFQISKLKEAVGQIETWFLNTIPIEDRSTAKTAQFVVWSDTFRKYWIGIDQYRIDAFLKQFPHSLDWLGEDLLNIIDYYDEGFFVNALSSLVEQNLLLGHKNISLCLLGGARKSTAYMCYVLKRDLKLDYHELRFILSQRSKRTTIFFIDDCLLSGTQCIHILSELLGISHKHPNKYEAPLSKDQIRRFKSSKLIFLFALGANAGFFRLKHFLSENGVDHEIVYAVEIPCLSHQGLQDLNDITLLDNSGTLSNSLRQLSQPIFAPWAHFEKPTEWEVAKDFCAEVGYSLLERYAKEGNWSDVRRCGSSLGYSGMQGRLVFSHNVPKTTLTLLWASGEYDGKPWIPLFPERT